MQLLTHSVQRVASADDLKLPGDYVQLETIELGSRVCTGLLLNCPFCGATNAIKVAPLTFFQKIIAYFRAKRLSIGTMVACYGNPTKHQFTVRSGEVIANIYA